MEGLIHLQEASISLLLKMASRSSAILYLELDKE